MNVDAKAVADSLISGEQALHEGGLGGGGAGLIGKHLAPEFADEIGKALGGDTEAVSLLGKAGGEGGVVRGGFISRAALLDGDHVLDELVVRGDHQEAVPLGNGGPQVERRKD